VAVVAGPGLAAADEEAVAVAAIHPDSSLLPSAEATGAAVLRAIDGASLAHLATHGRFRADNPLFSSLLLADGPLVAHDLTALAVAPSCVVLSACESATSGRTAGDDLLGMLAVLFSLGTRSVVASLVLVPDDATARLMVDMHRGLAAGRPLAVALSEGRDAALVRGGDDDLVAALGFNAYGDALDRV
jgi:CHAT domain-containing protein